MQKSEPLPELPIPLIYHTPEPRKSRARFWIAGAILLVFIVVGFLGIRWNFAIRAEANALSAARHQPKPAPISATHPNAPDAR